MNEFQTEQAALANDVARCDGVGFQEDGEQDWREGCEMCLRRTAPRGERARMMEPPAIIAFECEFLILPNAKNANAIAFRDSKCSGLPE